MFREAYNSTLLEAEMAKTRKDLQEKFAAEIYLSASFFKMSRVTLGDKYTPKTKLDAMIQKNSGAIEEMANRHVTQRFIPERDKMPKIRPARIEVPRAVLYFAPKPIRVAAHVFGPLKEIL